MFLSTTLCEHVWTCLNHVTEACFSSEKRKVKMYIEPDVSDSKGNILPPAPWHSLTFLDIPWHSLTLFSLVHLVQIELKPRRHDCPHRHFYRLRKGRCLRKQWMGARKAHHARVTIQSGEDESEVCEPQTANKFLRDWAFLWISFPIFFSSYPNHSCGSKLPHCCTKQNVLVHTTCAIRFDSVHLARHQKRRRCVASSSLRSLADSQSDCKSFMFVMTWSKQQKRLLKGNVVTVCYSMLPYIIVCYTMLHHVCIVFFHLPLSQVATKAISTNHSTAARLQGWGAIQVKPVFGSVLSCLFRSELNAFKQIVFVKS